MSKPPRVTGRLSTNFPPISQRLVPEHWPESDQAAWREACRAGRRLNPPGPAAHLRAATRHQQVTEWGFFLRFLTTLGELHEDEPVDQRLTPLRLGNYILAILEINRASTVRARIMQLSYVAGNMAPNADWSWVRRHPAIPSSRDALASQKPKSNRSTHAILPRALALCEGAAKIPHPILAAIQYRDGVLMAFAFWSALRRNNLASLEIGKSLIVDEKSIRIVFSDDEVKNHKFIDMLVPKLLCGPIRQYIRDHRPVLLQGSIDTGAFWIDKTGQPLSYHAVYLAFRAKSELLTGERLSPHSTRYSLASTQLAKNPLDIDLVASCLGHKGLSTAQRFYDQSSSFAANAAWQKLLRERCDD